jgi:glycosyltransferase involved in cell wall biosynthesis
MRLLYVANGFPPTALGGVEVYTYEVALAMRQRGHEVWVFCRESNFSRPDYFLLRDEIEGIPVFRVVNDFKGAVRFAQLYEDERIENLFQDILQKIRPNLVHFQHLIALSARLPEIANRLGYPVLMSLHDFWPLCHRVHLMDRWDRVCPGPFQGGDCVRCVFSSRGWGDLLARLRRLSTWIPPLIRQVWAQWWGNAPVLPWPSEGEDVFQARHRAFQDAFQACQLLLAPSAFVREVFVQNGWSSREIRVLPLGIAFSERGLRAKQKSSAESKLRIGYIGWYQPQKGVHLLLKAFYHLDSPYVSLHLFGPFETAHPYARSLQKWIRQDPRVHIHGSFSPEDRDQVYAQLDVLVIPSVSPETFSRVAREALVHKVPVIASRVGALKEIVIDGVNGYTFPPGNWQALLQILKELIQNPDRLYSLDLPGPIPILSVEDHADLLEQAYQECLAS